MSWSGIKKKKVAIFKAKVMVRANITISTVSSEIIILQQSNLI